MQVWDDGVVMVKGMKGPWGRAPRCSRCPRGGSRCPRRHPRPAPNRGRNISPWPKPGVQGSFRAPEVMGCWCPARGGGKDPASAPLQVDRGEDALGMSNPRELRSALLQLVGGRISARNKTKLGKGERICKLLPPWGHPPSTAQPLHRPESPGDAAHARSLLDVGNRPAGARWRGAFSTQEGSPVSLGRHCQRCQGVLPSLAV